MVARALLATPARCEVSEVAIWAVQGVKLQYGHVPVGARGDDEGGRRLSSLHAVQRHMVDTNQVTTLVRTDAKSLKVPLRCSKVTGRRSRTSSDG